MPTGRPDKALRRAVADLSAASPEDIEAVLAGLEARQRDAIEALLADYRGLTPPPAVTPPAPDAPEEIVLEGLSPWLAARLSHRSQPAASTPEACDAYAMTPTAFEALRACAADVRAAGKTPPGRRPDR